MDGNWALTQAPGLGGVANGFGGLTSFGITRKHISVSTSFDHLSPNFRVNDLGFLRNRVNRTQLGGRVTIEQPDPWRAFRRIGTTFSTSQAWNKDQLVFIQQASQSVSMQFRNFWFLGAGLTRDFETLDDLDTRGGPPIVNPATTFFFAQTWATTATSGGSRDPRRSSSRRRRSRPTRTSTGSRSAARLCSRWEYLRGSTLFLVWNMSTLDTSRAGEFSLLRDVQSTFGADGTHVFMVKASYWFSR